MIAPPLNDEECLGKLTEVAVGGQHRPDVRDVARRFRSTAELAAWIRTLPQRDDTGDPADGPRVQCEVSQRARLVAVDPNCVERSLLFVAAAELIDPRPVRQLATIDTTLGRHTFPVEDGEPVVLDPPITRNALLAGLWHIRNADQPVAIEAEIDPKALLGWLARIAEEPAAQRHGRGGVARVRRGHGAFLRLLDGRLVTPRERADSLYVLRVVGDAAPLFGPAGELGLRVARRAIACLLARDTTRNARINPERAVYWGGKGLATYFGLGGLYDPAYDEVVVRRRKRAPSPPPASPPPAVKVPAERGGDPTIDTLDSWSLETVNSNRKE